MGQMQILIFWLNRIVGPKLALDEAFVKFFLFLFCLWFLCVIVVWAVRVLLCIYYWSPPYWNKASCSVWTVSAIISCQQCWNSVLNSLTQGSRMPLSRSAHNVGLTDDVSDEAYCAIEERRNSAGDWKITNHSG